MRVNGRRTVWPIALIAVAGCAQLPVSQAYLSEPTYGVYLSFPADWRVLEAAKVEDGNYTQTFGVGLDSPDKALAGDKPSGFVSVALVDGTLGQVLQGAPSTIVTNFETAIKTGDAIVLQGPTNYEDESSVTREWVVQVSLGGSSEPLTYRQKVIVGKSPVSVTAQGERQLVKSLVVGCTGSCYADNEVNIAAVFTSWKVT